jgi:hypothetical protein
MLTCEAILDKLKASRLSFQEPHELLLQLAETVEQSMGGSSGAVRKS